MHVLGGSAPHTGRKRAPGTCVSAADGGYATERPRTRRAPPPQTAAGLRGAPSTAGAWQCHSLCVCPPINPSCDPSQVSGAKPTQGQGPLSFASLLAMFPPGRPVHMLPTWLYPPDESRAPGPWSAGVSPRTWCAQAHGQQQMLAPVALLVELLFPVAARGHLQVVRGMQSSAAGRVQQILVDEHTPLQQWPRHAGRPSQSGSPSSAAL
jgi:hypothetical protein